MPEKRTADISVINVYCVCRQPKRLPMACCDQCLEWYHSECVTIPDEIFSDMGKKWFCRRHAETTQGVTGILALSEGLFPHIHCTFSPLEITSHGDSELSLVRTPEKVYSDTAQEVAGMPPPSPPPLKL